MITIDTLSKEQLFSAFQLLLILLAKGTGEIRIKMNDLDLTKNITKFGILHDKAKDEHVMFIEKV